MKLFKVAVIAAIVVSGSAFAGAVPQFGGGHGGGWGHMSILTLSLQLAHPSSLN